MQKLAELQSKQPQKSKVLNLQVEQWDRKQGLVTALKVKQKTMDEMHHDNAGEVIRKHNYLLEL